MGRERTRRPASTRREGPRKRRRDPERTKALILEAATELFMRCGLNGASLDDISKKAGVNRGLIYHYYKTKEFLFDQGFNPDYGARPIKRAIERFVEDPLSEAVLRGEFQQKNRIVVTMREGHLFFDAEAKPKDEEEETVSMAETAE